MIQEEQNRLWNNLSYDQKMHLMKLYEAYVVNEHISEHEKGCLDMLVLLFGRQNLSSVTIECWEDVIKNRLLIDDAYLEYMKIVTLEETLLNWKDNNNLVYKKAIATLKLQMIIELGYDGLVTLEEIKENDKKQYPDQFWGIWVNGLGEVEYSEVDDTMDFILFRDYETGKKFMSHPSNVKLVKDYYMV